MLRDLKEILVLRDQPDLKERKDSKEIRVTRVAKGPVDP